MATAILDLHVENLPSTIDGQHDYEKAFVLLRYKNKPVGKTFLPVEDGVINVRKYHDKIMTAAAPMMWQKKAHDFLGWDAHEESNYKLPRATVAITTRDRAEDLRRCLDALISMPDDGQEIIVIDNCPATNDSFELVSRYKNVRYIREDFPGSSAARNRAILEARNEVIAFTDDDATPDKYWLRALLRSFRDPRVMCVTGQVMPLELQNEAQEWFESFSPLGRGFKRIEYDGAAFYNRFRVAPIGVSANMALRKSLIEKVGLFDEVLGVGTPTKCGEDHELFSRILGRGYKMVYDPEALSWHRHRRTWTETRKTLFGYGVGVYSFWMRTLLKEKEYGAIILPWKWFYYTQFPNLIRSLRKKPGSIPLDLVLAELRGCVVGTRAYFRSRVNNRKLNKKQNRQPHVAS